MDSCGYHKPYSAFIPIGSMYGIYANIGGISMVNVTIYSIHGSYGLFTIIYYHLLSFTIIYHDYNPVNVNPGLINPAV